MDGSVSSLKALQAPRHGRQTIRVGETVYAFDGSRVSLEARMRIMFPEARETSKLAIHVATVLGQKDPVPDSVILDAQAIQAAWAMDGEDAPDIVDIVRVAVADLPSFLRLAGAASMALGLSSGPVNAGRSGWEAIYARLRAALVASRQGGSTSTDELGEMMAIVRKALGDYGADPGGPLVDDLEGLAGNSEAAPSAGA